MVQEEDGQARLTTVIELLRVRPTVVGYGVGREVVFVPLSACFAFGVFLLLDQPGRLT